MYVCVCVCVRTQGSFWIQLKFVFCLLFKISKSDQCVAEKQVV